MLAFRYILTSLGSKLKESLLSVLPVSVLVVALSLTPWVDIPLKELNVFVAGALMLILGIGLFNLGADMAMTPMGQYIGEGLTKSKRMGILIGVAFVMGALITIAEPDLAVLAEQVSSIMNGTVLIATVGVGVGLMLMLGVIKIIFHGDLTSLLLYGYMALFCLAAVLFGGMMTQYYFVFYAFFLCAAFDIAMLLRKEYRCALRFSLFALAGVGLMVCAFRASLQQVFLGNGQAVGGISVLDALRKTATYGERLGSFWEKVKLMLRGMRWAAAGAAVCILLSVRKLPGLIRNKRIPFDALVILLPLPCAYIVSVLIAPLQAQELRYIYNLTPIAAAGIGFLLCLPDRSLGEARYGYVIRKAAVLLVFSAALLSAKAKPPATLFVEQPQYIALARANAGRKCVYLTDGPRAFGPVTQDLLELKCFPDFFVTNDTASAALKEYLGDADSAVLYISTNDYWTDGYGFDSEDELRSFGEDTGLTESELLYRYDFEGQGGLSETYLMKGMKP